MVPSPDPWMRKFDAQLSSSERQLLSGLDSPVQALIQEVDVDPVTGVARHAGGARHRARTEPRRGRERGRRQGSRHDEPRDRRR